MLRARNKLSLLGRDLNCVIHTERITTASCDALEQRVAFLNRTRIVPPSCLVLDVSPPDLNGLELQRGRRVYQASGTGSSRSRFSELSREV